MTEAIWLFLGALVTAGLLVSPDPLPHPQLLSPAREVGLPATVVLGGLPEGCEIGVRMLDSYDRVLVEDAGKAAHGTLRLELYYDLPASQQGRIEAFLPCPGLDQVILASWPIRFKEVSYLWVKVYFLDGDGKPFPLIRRVPRTAAVATQALRLLLSGPTWREGERGFWSALPSGTELVGVTISAGVAEVWVDTPSGGLASELLSLARAQIEKTLLEFPTVSQVRVYVDGKGVAP